MATRRKFIQVGGVAGAASLLPWRGLRSARAEIPGGTLAAADVEKFALPLVKPPAMPGSFRRNKDKYDIAVRQFEQRILSPPHPLTKVWSYGARSQPGTVAEGGSFNYPAFTIEARWNKDTQVQWRNELVDAAGNYLPHLLPADPTLHWANPPGGLAGRDTRPSFGTTPGPYTGPVPIVTHVHGAHTREDSDGYPEAWYLPAAANIPAGYARTGTYFDVFSGMYGHAWEPGTATFRYGNDQRATTLWYHDHTLGMTRLNVYAGPAGFYLIRGGPDDTDLGYVAPGVGDDPLGEYTEIPIVIQDRSFDADGALFYPDSRTFFDGFPGPYIPDTTVAPIWNPEFFGNMMVVNGFTWPYLDVEQRRYRFRLLNGCNSRFLVLKLSNGMPFWQIGADGGFLPQPAPLTELVMAPAERADVIVDFSQVPAGTEIVLENVGPDEPYGGGVPGDDFAPADPTSTGLVMQFRVKPATSVDTTVPPGSSDFALPALSPLGQHSGVHNVTLNEEVYEPADIPTAALLGSGTSAGGLLWSDPVTEQPLAGTTEEWTIYNFTEDAHPIHIHLVQFQVVGRISMGGGTSIAGQNGPLPGETGFKDTVIAYPGEETRLKARFDVPGLYVWHCHIVEHEDNEMMRPYRVV